MYKFPLLAIALSAFPTLALSDVSIPAMIIPEMCVISKTGIPSIKMGTKTVQLQVLQTNGKIESRWKEYDSLVEINCYDEGYCGWVEVAFKEDGSPSGHGIMNMVVPFKRNGSVLEFEKIKASFDVATGTLQTYSTAYGKRFSKCTSVNDLRNKSKS